MLTNNIDDHDLGADHFTQRDPNVFYAGSPNRPTPSATPSASIPSQKPRRQAELGSSPINFESGSLAAVEAGKFPSQSTRGLDTAALCMMNCTNGTDVPPIGTE